ncbi:flavin reductase family protein [Actinomycetospora rhizophila]|uniref:Flavin reductase family protein n=1 Tax=Actinomycetospora rhizophila TaxID=1416876 RepID=A0ABV9ZC38_9PSEU
MTTVEAADLRSCLGRFATGVTVVSYAADGKPRGATVNAFSSVSLDPPLVLVSIARSAKACPLLENSAFCVNVLAADQVDIAMNFAGKPTDRPVHWDHGDWAPRLRESHAWLECKPWRAYDGGDHVLYLGEVQQLSIRASSEPLLFHAGSFLRRGDGLDRDGQRIGRAIGHPLPPAPAEDEDEIHRFAREGFAEGWL